MSWFWSWLVTQKKVSYTTQKGRWGRRGTGKLSNKPWLYCIYYLPVQRMLEMIGPGKASKKHHSLTEMGHGNKLCANAVVMEVAIRAMMKLGSKFLSQPPREMCWNWHALVGLTRMWWPHPLLALFMQASEALVGAWFPTGTTLLY